MFAEVGEEVREKMKALRPYLPSGYTKKAAEKFGVSQPLVSNVLCGRIMRWDIIAYIVEMAENNKRVMEKLDELANPDQT